MLNIKVNDIKEMNSGDRAKVIKLLEHSKLLIQFKDGQEKIVTKNNFECGRVRNRNSSTIKVYGIGINDRKIYHNCKQDRAYIVWSGILYRVASNKDNCYKDVDISAEWLIYSNFKKWYDENYYEVEGEKVTIDKDLFNPRDNKIYSKETCVFVPQRINRMFVEYCRDNSYKERIISVLENQYKDKIPTRVYNALVDFFMSK